MSLIFIQKLIAEIQNLLKTDMYLTTRPRTIPPHTTPAEWDTTWSVVGNVPVQIAEDGVVPLLNVQVSIMSHYFYNYNIFDLN